MDEGSSGSEPVGEETRPDWGRWSVGRAFGWALVGGLLVVVLAGFAMGGFPPAAGQAVDDGIDAAGGSPVAPTDATASTDHRSATGTTDRAAAPDSEQRTWETYDTVVVFRNDDIQPHYRMETMRAVDQIFIEENVPVTLGVIPNVGGEVPIGDSNLCSYLRSRSQNNPGSFDVALHGYTHDQRTEFFGGSEFGGLEEEHQQTLITTGTRELTECVGERPIVFVPPMDTYDATTVELLQANGYTVVSGGGWFTEQYYNETGVFRQGGLTHVSNHGGFVANWTSNEFYDSATLERRFDWVAEDDGIYIQMLHYQDFSTEERRTQLREFIQYIKSSGEIRFMTLSELGECIEEGTLTRTDDGWRVYE